ncbi:MAG: polysaccharide lyase family 7 protein, partial [Leeuwenhoekiella sp.]
KENPHKITEMASEFTKEQAVQFPSDVLADLEKWRILLGNGIQTDMLSDFKDANFFYVETENQTNWVVFKTPNSGTTSKNSSNTRSELGQKQRWTPEEGGKLNASLKVQHVSTSGDARVAASYSTVVGQIHSDEGHENEPLKIFYKKFPGHKKGSIFWHYEINTEGTNDQRWDFSTAVWGNDISVVGSAPDSYPEEPEDGIELGEEFSYEVNVFDGIMYLTFKSDNHETRTFTKNLIKSDYTKDSDVPQQIRTLYASIDRDGTEQEEGYSGELQFFKLGAYNQTNGKNPENNMVWSTGATIYDGDLTKQYENGSYTEVWFKEASLSAGTIPSN